MILKLIYGDFTKFISSIYDLEVGQIAERPHDKLAEFTVLFGTTDLGAHPLKIWKGGSEAEEVYVGHDVEAYLCTDDGNTIERLWRAREVYPSEE